MDETAAGEVVLLQAFETIHPASPSWGDEDRAWATRLALDDGVPADDAPGFVARRAHHAMQRLGPREPAAARWLARRLWRLRWAAWVALGSLLLGLLADSIGSGQRINLLAPPLWAVVGWNLVVYLLLLGHALAHVLAHRTRPAGLRRFTQRLLRLGRGLPGAGSLSASAGASARALQAFASLWMRCTAAVSAARAATLLHVAAAALAVGLIAGLYLRGLALDYRAVWESTFLDAATVRAILAAVLAPALAISGIEWPDAAAFEALRVAHGSASAGAPAAPWIHLLALTLLLLVVLPRAALALASALRGAWLARHMEVPLHDDYFQRLLRRHRGETARVVVVPYANTPDAQAGLGLRALLMPAVGDGAQLHIAPTRAFGAEDEAPASAELPPGTTLAIAWFDLTATPEPDNQGRFAQQLAAQASTLLMIDEGAFRRRFGSDSQRIAQRRDAWRVFAEGLGTLPVFADLDAPDADAVARAVTLAMRSPVHRSAP